MSTPSDEDARFIAALRRRDEPAFNQLVLRYQDRVHNICFRLLGSHEDAREVAQETFVSVFTQIESFRGDSQLGTWVYRIATNHAKNRIKYLARRHDRKRTSIEDLAESVSDGRLSARVARPDEELDGRQLEAFLQAELAALDEEQRVVVVLRDIEGLSYEEVSEVTGLNLGTVKSRLHRARTQLNQAVQGWMRGERGLTLSRRAG
jgi:RNA polymerase sigma-70 factor (ECF subfamily)